MPLCTKNPIKIDPSKGGWYIWGTPISTRFCPMTPLTAFLKKHSLAIKIVAGLGIFAVLMARMDWSLVENMTLNMSFGLSAIAFGLIFLQLMLLAFRWQIFMNAEEHLIGYKIALNITTASQLANFLFITSVGGILVKVALARHYGLSLFKAICATIADRLMTLLAIITYAVLFLPALTGLLPSSLIDTILGFAALALVVSFLFPSLLINFLKPLIMKNRQIASTAIYLRNLVRTPSLAGPVLASSLAAQIFYFLAVCFAARSIGLEFSVAQMIAMLPMITLISSLPIGLGGWGIREGAFVFGLGLIGIPTESAFLISVQIGILGILTTLAAALPAFLTGNLQNVFEKAHTFKKDKQA